MKSTWQQHFSLYWAVDATVYLPPLWQNQVTLRWTWPGSENANFWSILNSYQFRCFLMICAAWKDDSIEVRQPSVVLGVAEIGGHKFGGSGFHPIHPLPKCGSCERKHFGSVCLGYPGDLWSRVGYLKTAQYVLQYLRNFWLCKIWGFLSNLLYYGQS